MSVAEGRPEPAHDRVSVSDAIEDELHRLETGCPPTIRTRVLGILQNAGKAAKFLVRPESMTAYATLAAAFAAFLAVKAAERQEKATFTSALFSKQVDLLATTEEKFLGFIRDSGPIRNSYLHSRKSAGALQFSMLHLVNYETIFTSYMDFVSSFDALYIVYPKEAEPFLVMGIRAKTDGAMIIIDDIKDAETKLSKLEGKQTPEDEITRGALTAKLESDYKNISDIESSLVRYLITASYHAQ